MSPKRISEEQEGSQAGCLALLREESVLDARGLRLQGV